MPLTTTHLLAAATAFAALTSAQETSQNNNNDAAEVLSVVSVLQTALPSSLLNEALTNSAGVSSELASEFAAGETPAWFSSLPNGVKTFLIPTLTDLPPQQTGSMAMTTLTGTATETGHTTKTKSGDSTGTSKTKSETKTHESKTSEAGAAPTGAVVAGVAGLAGLVGVLAL